MKIIRWASDMQVPNNVGLIIGNFDGVHRGHQDMLQRLKDQCLENGLVPCAMSFFPHPREVIQNRHANLITSFRDRAHWLANFGLAYWFVLPFTPSFRNISPDYFIQHYLIDRLAARYLLVGDDFRFGFKGKGDFHLLQDYANDHYKLAQMPTVTAPNGTRISSSAIRQLLQNNELDKAINLLGHDITFTAKVRHGDARGRALSARTANLHVRNSWCLPDGVYVVKIRLADSKDRGRFLWGVANLGVSPTFDGSMRKLEVHVLDENCPDLYGQVLQVSLLRFIRKEKKFDDKIALQQQIFQDIHTAKAFIAQQLQGK